MDPRRTAIVSASLNSYRHEMLMANARGIPVLQQHGEKDDNVPAYNSRLLSQLLFQEGTSSNYYELPSAGHWFDEVMTTSQLKSFYREQTAKNETLSRNATTFDIVVADPGDMGSKGGIRVLQLEDPGQYGRVHVTYQAATKAYVIKTSNVLSLELNHRFAGSGDGKVAIDGTNIDVVPSGNGEGAVELSRGAKDSLWKVSGKTAVHLICPDTDCVDWSTA